MLSLKIRGNYKIYEANKKDIKIENFLINSKNLFFPELLKKIPWLFPWISWTVATLIKYFPSSKKNYGLPNQEKRINIKNLKH